MVLDMCVKFGVHEKSGSRDTGSKGVQNGVFRELFQKYMLNPADFRLEGTAMILDMCVKFGVMYDIGSQDTGSNGVQNGVFREFLKKYMLYLADFRAERNYYGT